jgi:hypothetical protein
MTKRELEEKKRQVKERIKKDRDKLMKQYQARVILAL